MDKGPGGALLQRRTENTEPSPSATPIPPGKTPEAQSPAPSPACFHYSFSPLS